MGLTRNNLMLTALMSMTIKNAARFNVSIRIKTVHIKKYDTVTQPSFMKLMYFENVSFSNVLTSSIILYGVNSIKSFNYIDAIKSHEIMALLLLSDKIY